MFITVFFSIIGIRRYDGGYVFLMKLIDFDLTGIEIRREIVRVSTMAKTSSQSVRKRVHIQRDQRR